VLIKQSWKGRKTSCAAKDGLFPSETFRRSFIYVQNTKLGIAMDRAIYKPNFMTRSKGGKPVEVVLLGILGRCAPLRAGCPRAGAMRASPESPKHWEELSGASDPTAAWSRATGWCTGCCIRRAGGTSSKPQHCC